MNSACFDSPPFHWLREAIGVDITGGNPVCVHTRRIRGRLRHQRIENLSAPSRAGIHVIGCLNNSESVVRRLEAPFSATYKARRVFPALLDLRLPFPETECERVFIDLQPAASGGRQALAVAARRKTIQARIAVYRSLANDPLLLDQEALALWTQSLLEETPASAVSTADTTRLVVALRYPSGGSGGTLCIGRGRTLASTGNLSADIVADIERRLKAMNIAADKPLEVRWTGGGASDAGLVKSLIDAFDNLRPAVHVVHNDPETMTARALTTRAMSEGPCRCNLRRGSLLHPVISRRQRSHSMISTATAAMTGLFLLAIGIRWNSVAARHERRLHDAVAERAEKIAGYASGLRGEDAVEKVRQHVGKIAAQAQPFAELLAADVSDGLETVIEAAKQNAIEIHALKLQTDVLALEASAERDKLAAFSQTLEKSFGNLSLQRQQDYETGEGKINFVLESPP